MAEYAPIDVSQHTVDDLAFGCMDFRYLRAFNAINEQDIGPVDGPRWPAPSKTIASGFANDMLRLAHNLHGIKRLHIKDHTFCGGFMEDYLDPEDEDTMVEAHLPVQNRAVEMAQTVLPHLTVVTYVVGSEKVLDRRIFPNG